MSHDRKSLFLFIPILVCLSLILAFVNYVIMPTWNGAFFDGYFLAFCLSFLGLYVYSEIKGTEINYAVFSFIGFVIFLLITIVNSAPMFHSASYRNLIGQVKSKDFNKSLPPIDIKNAPLVSEHMAIQYAQKKLSDIPALGSQVVLGDFVKQNVKGKLYWVSFLEHSGFFQWNKTGATIGYVKVSASNPEDVELVTSVDNKPLTMKYIDSAYFGNNAYRRIYSENKNLGISDLSSEIDDDGRPYIVATLYDKTIGFGGADVVGIAILDVQTGEVKNYNLQKDVPAWVDRVYPADLLKSQVDDWGKYVNGWFNPSNQGRLKVSNKVDLVYGEDGNCYFYLGITSVGRDNGIVGFMLVNSRTKETILYHLSGADEDVAARTAEGSMPEKHYTATNPLPFSVDGVPTYILTLTDNNGIPRAYAMIDILQYQTLAVQDTLQNTYQLYLNKLAHGNPGVSISDKKENVVSLKGVVDRISNDMKNGTSIYYMTLKGNEHIFTSTSDISEKLVLSKVGDSVNLSVEKSDQKLFTILKFENNNIK
jgi:hypothetical protein